MRVPTDGTTRLELKKTTSQKILVQPDKERIIFKLKNNNYIDNKEFPRENSTFSVLEYADIINRYNRMITGIANYYKICDNNGTIHYLDYLLKYSCVKTLAQRHRITAGQVFSKYGKTIKATLNTKDGRVQKSELVAATKWIQQYRNNPNHKQCSLPFFDPFMLYSCWRTKIKPYLHCCACESNIKNRNAPRLKLEIRKSKPPNQTKLFSGYNEQPEPKTDPVVPRMP